MTPRLPASDPEVSVGASASVPHVGLNKVAVFKEDLPTRVEIILESGAQGKRENEWVRLGSHGPAGQAGGRRPASMWVLPCPSPQPGSDQPSRSAR